MERVQRRATKLIPALRNKLYEQTLFLIDLTTRRVMVDLNLIEEFEMLKGFWNCEYKQVVYFVSNPDYGTCIQTIYAQVSFGLYKTFLQSDSGQWVRGVAACPIKSELDQLVARDSIAGFNNRLDFYLKVIEVHITSFPLPERNYEIKPMKPFSVTSLQSYNCH